MVHTIPYTFSKNVSRTLCQQPPLQLAPLLWRSLGAPLTTAIRATTFAAQRKQCRPCSLVQAVCSLARGPCGGTTAPKPCSPRATASAKKNQQAGHLATRRDASQSSNGATSSTREPIHGLLNPKGQAHTPPGNLWPYKNAGSMCCECLRTDTRKTTTHTTQSAADGRREGSGRHCGFSSSRRE